MIFEDVSTEIRRGAMKGLLFLVANRVPGQQRISFKQEEVNLVTFNEETFMSVHFKVFFKSPGL